MLVKEGKDLVPAVDRLLGPVIRPIPCEEGVTRAVLAVKFVILAEPLNSPSIL